MADQPAEGAHGLHARLISVPFERLLPILTGRERITNLPVNGYIRSAQVNMATQCFELMLIDTSYSPTWSGQQIPSANVEFEVVKPPAKKRK